MSNPQSDFCSAAAAWYGIPRAEIRAAIDVGLIPGPESRDWSVKFRDDLACKRSLERCRHNFDTEIPAFIAALRTELAHSYADPDGDGDGRGEFGWFERHLTDADYYLVDRLGDAWQGHRVAVIAAELRAAGYASLVELQKVEARALRECMEHPSAERDAMYMSAANAASASKRSFLKRLIGVLESRDDATRNSDLVCA